MAKFQIKRGKKVNLPTLAEGEFGYCTDTKELYIGSTSGNVLVTANLNPDNLTKAVPITKGGTGASTATEALVNLGALAKTGDASDVVNAFTQASTRGNLTSKEKLSVSLGKLMKWFSDLKAVAFSGNARDLLQDSNNRLVTDTEKSVWNAKQNALGYTPINSTLKGAANGLAELDSAGKVLSSQLPSYVDDVLEYTAKSGFPTMGETGKIYVDKATNITWRWGGSSYVEISPSIALGVTSSTAYRGDRGKTAYDHSLKTSGNPHSVTKSEVGLSNVPNVTTNNQTPTYTAAVSLVELSSGETLATAFGKLKLTVKNVISLVKLLGTTDISSIGGGTVTGALSTLNSNLEMDISDYVAWNSSIIFARKVAVYNPITKLIKISFACSSTANITTNISIFTINTALYRPREIIYKLVPSSDGANYGFCQTVLAMDGTLKRSLSALSNILVMHYDIDFSVV